VPPVVHFLATCLVALGASFSAFWIMAANAWMQTPTGFEWVNGKFMVTSFRDVIFNPAFPTHLSHMLMASYETTAFVVAGISAFYLLKNKHPLFYQHSLMLALAMAALCAPLQVLVGDFKGQNVARFQPAKLAAMEAHWETNTSGGASFVAFGLPDMAAEKNHFEVLIPNALSLLITHSPDGRIQGLKEFPREDRPNVPVIFWTFRIMVAIGFLFAGVMLWAVILWWKKRLYTSRWFLMALVAIQPLGFLATILGWVTSEMGRQPWVVYGILRTTDSASPIAAGNVVWSLALFLLFFALIGVSYFHYILKMLRLGPDLVSPMPSLQLPAGMKTLKSEMGTREVS